MTPTTSAKAWVALLTAAAGVAALYGIHVTLPDSDTLTTVIGLILPLVTAGATWLMPNQPKP